MAQTSVNKLYWYYFDEFFRLIAGSTSMYFARWVARVLNEWGFATHVRCLTPKNCIPLRFPDIPGFFYVLLIQAVWKADIPGTAVTSPEAARGLAKFGGLCHGKPGCWNKPDSVTKKTLQWYILERLAQVRMPFWGCRWHGETFVVQLWRHLQCRKQRQKTVHFFVTAMMPPSWI